MLPTISGIESSLDKEEWNDSTWISTMWRANMSTQVYNMFDIKVNACEEIGRMSLTVVVRHHISVSECVMMKKGFVEIQALTGWKL